MLHLSLTSTTGAQAPFPSGSNWVQLLRASGSMDMCLCCSSSLGAGSSSGPTPLPPDGSCNLPDPGGNCLPGLLVTSCPGSPSPIHTSATNSPLISFSAEVPGRVPVTWTRALHPLFYTVRCSPNCTQHSPTGFLSDYRVCSHRILSAFK